jgi:UPF0716 family protein affecting phage T7 exclusion
MAKGLGCLVLLAAVAWIGVELIVYYEATVLLNRQFEASIGSGGWVICVVWTVLMLVIGVKLAKAHLPLIMAGLLTGTAGRHLIAVIGAILLAIPGLLSDVFGLLLLFPPVQILLGKLGTKLVSSISRFAMQRAMGGAGGPFAGGFPGGGFPGGGFPGGAFPGMKQMTPDDRARFPTKKPGKIIDVTPEK